MTTIFNIDSKRDSNGELLRLICMQFILIHHFLIYALPVDIRSVVWPMSAESMVAIMVTGFVYVAVNCFILISGFYRIKFKWSGVLNIYLFIVFYNLLWMAVHQIIGDKSFSLDYLLKSVLVFSHNGSPWFLTAYMVLYCVSPILNKAIEFCTKWEFETILILLTILNVYFGYGCSVDGFNPNGYNYQQFIYVYMIGAYLKRYYGQERIDSGRWQSFGIWSAAALLWGVLTIANAHLSIPIWKPWTYNNPIVLIGSMAFFCFMMSCHFQNRWVNAIAVSTLSIYLMQTKCFSVYCNALMNPVRGWCQTHASWAMIPIEYVVIVLAVLFFSGVCIMVDQIRLIAVTPIVNMLKRKENREIF